MRCGRAGLRVAGEERRRPAAPAAAALLACVRHRWSAAPASGHRGLASPRMRMHACGLDLTNLGKQRQAVQVQVGQQVSCLQRDAAPPGAHRAHDQASAPVGRAWASKSKEVWWVSEGREVCSRNGLTASGRASERASKWRLASAAPPPAGCRRVSGRLPEAAPSMHVCTDLSRHGRAAKISSRTSKGAEPHSGGASASTAMASACKGTPARCWACWRRAHGLPSRHRLLCAAPARNRGPVLALACLALPSTCAPNSKLDKQSRQRQCQCAPAPCGSRPP